MKRCYVAGKISDLPEQEYVANFHTGAAEVERMGMVPVVPIDLNHEHDKSWLSHMRVDLTALLACDCVYALRNWPESRGATIEVDLARSLGMPVIEQGEPVSHLPKKEELVFSETDYCEWCKGSCQRTGPIYDEDFG